MLFSVILGPGLRSSVSSAETIAQASKPEEGRTWVVGALGGVVRGSDLAPENEP